MEAVRLQFLEACARRVATKLSWVREPFELKAHAVSCPKYLGADSGGL
jgi:hypothetical protein